MGMYVLIVCLTVSCQMWLIESPYKNVIFSVFITLELFVAHCNASALNYRKIHMYFD